MPVQYSIDPNTHRIHTTCSGNTTFPEVCEHFRELGCDPEFRDSMNVLLDLSTCTSLPTTAQLEGVVSQIANLGGRLHFGLCAVIAPGDALFGMLRIFEVYSQEFFAGIEVFRSVAEGEHWLASRREMRNQLH